MKTKQLLLTVALASAFSLQPSALVCAAPLGTAFTYQGRLNDGAGAANGTYDLKFTLYDDALVGNSFGVSLTNAATSVSNGLFTVTLDFSAAAFDGGARWLGIEVRTNGASLFVTLAPRQPLTPAPYALYAAAANTVNGSVPVAQLSGTVAAANLPANVAYRDASPQTFTGQNAFHTAVVDPFAFNNGTVWSGLTFGSLGSGEGLGSKRTAGGNQYGLDFYTYSTPRMSITSSGNVGIGTNDPHSALHVVGTVTAASFSGSGNGLTDLWKLSGNAGTTPGTHFLGTTDNQPLELKVNNVRALRLGPTANDADHSGIVNLVGGAPVNSIAPGVYGSVIAGGGAANYYGSAYSNDVSADFSFLGGGAGNSIQPNASVSFLGGGGFNSIQADAAFSFLGGGHSNSIRTSATHAFLGGGASNTVSGAGGFVGGGGYDGSTIQGNTASGAGSVVVGGTQNIGRGSRSTIGGGHNNSATNWYATVPGGAWNLAGGQGSLAAGRAAKALHDGTFVWSDTSSPDFVSTATEQFLIRASGGVGIGTNHPQSALHVVGTVTADAFITAGPAANEPPSGVTPILNMVWIKPGTFVMGSSTNELDRGSDEGPQTVVTLTKGFWMGHHEVTQGEFQSLMNSNPSAFTGDLSLPVEKVSWFDATDFCGVLTQREQAAGRLPAGWGYRLPTEAEWEYCCRALTTTRFYYGDDPSYTSLTNYAWYTANSGRWTHPVGQKLANAWGLVDMSGNVWEWCRDWYAVSYPGGSLTDPVGPGSGSFRVRRGGSWDDTAANCRSACRSASGPANRFATIGFRVVLSPGQP